MKMGETAGGMKKQAGIAEQNAEPSFDGLHFDWLNV